MPHAGPDPVDDHPQNLSPATAHDADERGEPPQDDLQEKASSLDLPSHKDDSNQESPQNEEKPADLEPAQTYATTASAATRPESHVQPKRKPWYKNLNPLRWGKIPPVPETRSVSREYNAPFLSLVYFQWMAPIISVSAPAYRPLASPRTLYPITCADIGVG
jgi:ATP-binding cassette subfamily C (CFTR/MRP) protein 1